MQQQNKNIFTTLSLVNLALMFCLPFMVSYHHLPEANYYDQLAAFVLGFSALAVFFRGNPNGLTIPILLFVPALLITLLGLQWLSGVGVYWQEPFMGALYLLWAGALMVVVQRLRQIYSLERLIVWLAFSLLVGGAFNAIVVMMQLVGLDDFFWTFPRIRKAYTGNLAQVNLLTDYLSISLVSWMYLLVKGKVKLALACVAIVPYLIALSLSGSRMSWLYLLMITVSFYFYGRGQQENRWLAAKKLILIMPLLYGLIQYVLPYLYGLLFSDGSQFLPPPPAERIVEFAGQHSKRIDLIKEAVDIAGSHPLLGVGWGQYPWYDLLYAEIHANHRGYITHCHNLFVQLLAEMGVFALVTALVGSVYWLFRLFSMHNTIERWWLMLVGGIIFVHSMLEYPLWYAHFLGVFFVVVALAGGDGVELQFIKAKLQTFISLVIVLASLALVGVTTMQYSQIEYWVNYYPKFNNQERLRMLEEMTLMHDKTLVVQPVQVVLTRAYSLLPRKQAPLEVKIAKYESALRYSQDKEDIYRYVLLLAIDGQIDKAKRFLKRAYTRQPGYAKHFEKQLEKGAAKNHEAYLVLYEELHRLKQEK